MKPSSAFFHVVTAILSLFVVHRSSAADAAQNATAIRPFTLPKVPPSALDDLHKRELRTAFKSLR